MKKIIATVLAMVMALALCSTAFATTDTWVIYKVKDDGTKIEQFSSIDKFVKYDAKDSGTTKNVEYWIYNGNAAYTWVACDQDDAKVEGEKAYYVMYRNGTDRYDFVKSVGADGANYTVTVTEQDETKDKASCTVTHYTKDGYLDDGDFYVKDNNSDTVTARIANTNKVVKVSKVASSDKNSVVYASHILGTATKNSDKGYYEAKCLVCGATVALTNEWSVLEKNGIKPKDTYNYNASDADAVRNDNDNKGAYSFVAGTKFADSYTYAWDLTSGSSTTATDGKTSPKTFDAGVAMYVGMALASVTGSAVVIGKKKEF